MLVGFSLALGSCGTSESPAPSSAQRSAQPPQNNRPEKKPETPKSVPESTEVLAWKQGEIPGQAKRQALREASLQAIETARTKIEKVRNAEIYFNNFDFQYVPALKDPELLAVREQLIKNALVEVLPVFESRSDTDAALDPLDNTGTLASIGALALTVDQKAGFQVIAAQEAGIAPLSILDALKRSAKKEDLATLKLLNIRINYQIFYILEQISDIEIGNVKWDWWMESVHRLWIWQHFARGPWSADFSELDRAQVSKLNRFLEEMLANYRLLKELRWDFDISDTLKNALLNTVIVVPPDSESREEGRRAEIEKFKNNLEAFSVEFVSTVEGGRSNNQSSGDRLK